MSVFNKSSNRLEAETAREIITALIKTVGIRAVAVGLHNSISYGDVFKSLDMDFTDEDLKNLYAGIEVFSAAAKILDEKN